MKSIKKLILICTVLGLIICSFLFDKTEGLVDSYNNFVYEYMSTGSNDDVCIGLSVVIFLPFCILLFTLKKKIMIYEFITCNISILLQLILLLLIDIGSITNTIKNGNIPLLFWCLFYFLIFFELYGFFIFEQIQLKKDK